MAMEEDKFDNVRQRSSPNHPNPDVPDSIAVQRQNQSTLNNKLTTNQRKVNPTLFQLQEVHGILLHVSCCQPRQGILR